MQVLCEWLETRPVWKCLSDITRSVCSVGIVKLFEQKTFLAGSRAEAREWTDFEFNRICALRRHVKRRTSSKRRCAGEWRAARSVTWNMFSATQQFGKRNGRSRSQDCCCNVTAAVSNWSCECYAIFSAGCLNSNYEMLTSGFWPRSEWLCMNGVTNRLGERIERGHVRNFLRKFRFHHIRTGIFFPRPLVPHVWILRLFQNIFDGIERCLRRNRGVLLYSTSNSLTIMKVLTFSQLFRFMQR